MTHGKIEGALFGSTWLAIGLAFAGAISTPRNYCYYEGAATPSGLILVYVGLGLALLLQFGAIVAVAVRESSFRASLVSVSLGGLALAAGIAVVALTQHQTASWGCG